VVIEGRDEHCLECQHCLAVCSTGAVSIGGFSPDESISLPAGQPSFEQLVMLVKARRSVRHYLKTPVPAEQITALLDAAAYAPTAVNNRQVLLTVVEDVAVMEQVRRKTYQRLAELVAAGGLSANMAYFETLIKDALGRGVDVIYREAPHLLIASSPIDGPSPDADCFIALAYFELLAVSQGLGTLWCGLARWALTQVAADLLGALGVPPTHKVGYMMMFGQPDIAYHRTVQRGSGQVNRVTRLSGPAE